MDKLETKKLLAEIAVIDGREISDEAVDIWNDILKLIPLDIAREAHKLCRQDDKIRYLEPKHIYAKAMDAARKLHAQEEQARRLESIHAANQSKPCPRCNHGKAIIACDHCCDWIYRYHVANHPNRAHGDPECGELIMSKRIPLGKALTPMAKSNGAN